MKLKDGSMETYMKPIVAIGCVIILLSACAGMSSSKSTLIPPSSSTGIPMARAVKMAGLVLEELGYGIKKQDPLKGYIFAEKKEKDFLSLDYMTYFMEVRLNRSQDGGLAVNARAIAGPEIAFTTDLPFMTRKFLNRFKERINAVNQAPSIALAPGFKEQNSEVGGPSVRVDKTAYFSSEGKLVQASNRPGPAKALIKVGELSVTAEKAKNFVGEGMREMLETQLFDSGYFTVVEDVQGANPQTPDLIISGTVSEFEMTHINTEALAMLAVLISKSPTVATGYDLRTAHIALDVRVTDAKTGQVILSNKIKGIGKANKATLFGGARGNMAGSLESYRKTPMEFAIRQCLNKTVYYLANHLPERYFRY